MFYNEFRTIRKRGWLIYIKYVLFKTAQDNSRNDLALWEVTLFHFLLTINSED